MILPLLLVLGAVLKPEVKEPVGSAWSSRLACPEWKLRCDPTCDPEWALEHVQAITAFENMKVEQEPGEGVLIAQLDTGYTRHPELGDALMPEYGYRYEYDDEQTMCKDPMDPLASLPFPLNKLPIRQPGHGTRTASVLISPPGRQLDSQGYVRGIVPGARVIPFRVTNGSVLSEGRSWNMARAITRVVTTRVGVGDAAQRVDIISISVGRRSPSNDLENALLLAERNGIIVVAAAGQSPFGPKLNGGAVRFPAQYPSVVAVTGTTSAARPWKFLGAATGPEVDIAAPAVDVWRADVKADDGERKFTVGRGKGTSFAAPLVAGAAALWIQRYGRAALDKSYGRSLVPAAFRFWLRKKGHRNSKEVCKLARKRKWPNALDVCRRSDASWDKNRGVGLLAVDRLVEPANTDGLPTAEKVCNWVFAERGANAWASVCPVGSPGWTSKSDEPFRKPDYRWDPARTFVYSVSLGKSFGGKGYSGEKWSSPAVSAGLILSRHQFKAPLGLFLQAKGGEHGVSAGVGFASLVDYGPLRNAEGKYAALPGFGAGFGYAAKVVYLRTAGRDHAGLEVQLVAYRVKFAAGWFWPLGAGGRRRVSTWDLGLGF